MKKTGFVTKMLNAFENLFMKNHACLVCLKEIPDDTKFMICNNCFNKMEKLDGNLCTKCGDKLSSEHVKLCDCCKEIDYEFSRNYSCFYYAENSAKLVKDLKYKSKKYYAKYIAEMMTNFYDYEGVDIITFVPLSRPRRKERGFNQAEEVAMNISKLTNIPCLPLLDKIKEGEHQARLDQKSRMKNLAGTFMVNKENENVIKGKMVLVIDDVFTTGSTLNECAKMLKTKKPKEIRTLTFAKTKFNSLKS